MRSLAVAGLSSFLGSWPCAARRAGVTLGVTCGTVPPMRPPTTGCRRLWPVTPSQEQRGALSNVAMELAGGPNKRVGAWKQKHELRFRRAAGLTARASARG